MVTSSYFDHYPKFDHDAQSGLLAEFERLSVSRGWKRGGKRYMQERALCCGEELQALVGGGKLEAIQQLCLDVGIDDVPDSITQCKKALSRVHVNIVDLIDARRMGTPLQVFPSRYALVQYTMKHKRFFPRDLAKEDGALRFLLVNTRY